MHDYIRGVLIVLMRGKLMEKGWMLRHEVRGEISQSDSR